MTELKLITQDSIPRAFAKAERYRLLNEPFLAESICLDILAIDPVNHDARVCLILSLADQVGQGTAGAGTRARAEVLRLEIEYERAYYSGILCERQGYSILTGHAQGSREAASHCIAEALHHYEKAHTLSPPSNEDATLRWNTCVRLTRRYSLEAPSNERHEYPLE